MLLLTIVRMSIIKAFTLKIHRIYRSLSSRAFFHIGCQSAAIKGRMDFVLLEHADLEQVAQFVYSLQGISVVLKHDHT